MHRFSLTGNKAVQFERVLSGGKGNDEERVRSFSYSAISNLHFVLWLACAANLAAQSNQTIDRLLDEKPATFGDIAYIILSAVGFVPESATAEEATAAVAQKKLLSKTPSPAEPATLGEVCYLIMETQGIRGGLFYSLFPVPATPHGSSPPWGS